MHHPDVPGLWTGIVAAVTRFYELANPYSAPCPRDIVVTVGTVILAARVPYVVVDSVAVVFGRYHVVESGTQAEEWQDRLQTD